MDLNLVVIAGTLAAPPDIRTFDSGTTRAHLLVTVRTTEPTHRVDVLKLTMWDTADGWDKLEGLDRGDRVHCVGAVQRKFWADEDGRRSKHEVIVAHLSINDESEDT